MIDKSKIPPSWQVVKLGEVCKDKEGLRRGPFGSAIKKEFFVSDGYKVYEQSNAIYNDAIRGKYFIDEKKYQELINFSVLPGDLIVSCSGTLGRIAEIPFNAKPGVINQALLRIRLLDNIISKKFFLYFFRSELFQRKIFDQSQGTAMSNLIGIKDFKEIELLLPPLPEQHRIVSKIEELFSELDKGIESLKTAQQQLKIYRQAVLKWAFEGKLTNKSVKDGELPKGWKLVVSSEIIDVRDGTHDTPKYVSENGIPLITSKNLKGNKIDFQKVSLISEEDHLEISKRSKVEEGDILFAMIGTIGNPAIIKGDANFSIKNVGLFKRNENEILPGFLVNYLSSSSFEKQLNDRKLLKGTTQKFIPLGNLRKILIPLPPLKEQQLIVDELESKLTVCDKLEETVTHSLQQSEALRQSILKKAFEGKLVAQNPKDEPAAKLLERIKAESAKAR